MSEELLQAEADELLAMPKVRADSEERQFPSPGRFVSAPLASQDGREHFLLDINRRSLNLNRVVFQNRAKIIVVQARLDLGGAPHRNPDDVEIGVPHLHLFREGFGEKWAFEVPALNFKDTSDRWQTLGDFMRFCNIVDPPIIHRDLVT